MTKSTGTKRTLRPETLAVRGGLARSQFEETSEALFINSGYVYDSAGAAESAFNGDIERFVYSRYGNPTVEVFQNRLALIDGYEACFATASGMSAVFNALAALLAAGDRIVAAKSLFGSCYVIINEILPRWGVTAEFVDGSDIKQWEKALSTPAQAVFFESPSNPMIEIVDIERVTQLAHAAGAKVVLDNVFATPVLQRGLDYGVDVVVYSATKHIDGQGRVMGGAILGTKEFIDGPVQNLMRHTGPSLSPFNAWVLTKGLETMAMRVEKSSASALAIATELEAMPGVNWLKYPLLPSHPQYDLAARQMSMGGTVLTFELAGGQAKAFEVLDKLEVIDISNNLGDSKSLITHPATTTHRRLGVEGRAEVGITDGVVRLSVGLENTDDLLDDLRIALGSF